ncbi:uncharacterized protein E0L32_005760 [Thyridium curvatum]|uniref:FAD/NAD(P)-binding domain-containing protein n=1 Tax=Thyridium curvatum TaxID=1093900 RepID=A0A507B421_9PEZI|nr:uncharacterized protein E0L32_005760 [Thyridium curvatum]TPX13816.1 hypothetical protein E0L32_005760 [Thyridium curvatum]
MTVKEGDGSNLMNVTADIVVVGGGFGGCYALSQLRKSGYTVKLLEAGSDFGGVWHFNRYPGARVDSEVPLYQLSLPQAWRSFVFGERFPGHVELRQYFEHLSDALDLRKDAIFNCRVSAARYDPDTRRWILRSQGGLTADCRFVIFATGTTNKAYIPPFAGLDNFKGKVIHPAAWPEELDIKGKKVGLVGQGASGLQILQEIAKKDCDVKVFVRSPPTALPMEQRSLTMREAEEQKNTYAALFNYAKFYHSSGYAHNPSPKSFYEATPEERQELYEELWRRGSYALTTSGFSEMSYDPAANAELYQFWAGKVRAMITDPVKREIMAPLKQFQWIGTKRPNLFIDYYEMIDRPNVELISLKENTIEKFVEEGVVVAGPRGAQTLDLDIVIVATGYDSVTGSLYDMNIAGRDGFPLQRRWANGINTYLGMLAPGLPNAFMLYGPQAPSGLANGPPFLELQVDWVVEFLRKFEKEGVRSFEVKTDAAERYRKDNLDTYNMLLLKDTPSWWNGSNIPGKVKEPLFWVKGMQAWRQETERALEDWSRFVLD